MEKLFNSKVFFNIKLSFIVIVHVSYYYFYYNFIILN